MEHSHWWENENVCKNVCLNVLQIIYQIQQWQEAQIAQSNTLK